jgi:hypothetical protein
MHGETVDGHERRAFYDFTVSAPKTFSVAAVTGGLEIDVLSVSNCFFMRVIHRD